MKTIVLKQDDGAVQIMRLIPIGVMIDGVQWSVGKLTTIEDVVKIEVSRDGNTEVLTFGAFEFFGDSGIDGVEFCYASVEGEVAKKPDAQKIVSWREMPPSAIPSDMTFRDAWSDETPDLKIDIDMDKAREVHKNRLRVARAPLLSALDTAYMRADEKGDAAAKKEIASKKQALRDITKHPAITAAVTTDELLKIVL